MKQWQHFTSIIQQSIDSRTRRHTEHQPHRTISALLQSIPSFRATQDRHHQHRPTSRQTNQTRPKTVMKSQPTNKTLPTTHQARAETVGSRDPLAEHLGDGRGQHQPVLAVHREGAQLMDGWNGDPLNR